MSASNNTTLRIGSVEPLTPDMLRQTRSGGSGGGRRSPVLESARNLEPGQALTITVEGPNGETGDCVTREMFNARKNSLSAGLRGKRANGQSTLGFDVTVRGDFANRQIRIIRRAESSVVEQ